MNDTILKKGGSSGAYHIHECQRAAGTEERVELHDLVVHVVGPAHQQQVLRLLRREVAVVDASCEDSDFRRRRRKQNRM